MGTNLSGGADPRGHYSAPRLSLNKRGHARDRRIATAIDSLVPNAGTSKTRVVRRASFLFLLLVLTSCSAAAGQETPQRLVLREVEPSSPFLQRQLPAYRNYAYTNFTNYPNHSTPYTDQPRTFYNSLGSHLITGYEIYNWRETRMPGQ